MNIKVLIQFKQYGVPENSPADRSYLLKSAGQRSLGDDHVWWSVFTRPFRSRFTRANRVTVCYVMFWLSMMANAVFYDVAPVRLSDGLFKYAMLTLDPTDVKPFFVFFSFNKYSKFSDLYRLYVWNRGLPCNGSGHRSVQEKCKRIQKEEQA